MQKICIIIADDHLLFAEGLCLLLKQHEEFIVAAVANNGKELLDILPRYPCEMLLLDLNMPGMNGFEALQYIRKSNQTLKVLVLSTYNDSHLIAKAKEAGANGYLTKTFGPDELSRAMKMILAGVAYFPPEKNSVRDDFTVQDVSKAVAAVLACNYGNERYCTSE